MTEREQLLTRAVVEAAREAMAAHLAWDRDRLSEDRMLNFDAAMQTLRDALASQSRARVRR